MGSSFGCFGTFCKSDSFDITVTPTAKGGSNSLSKYTYTFNTVLEMYSSDPEKQREFEELLRADDLLSILML